MINKKIIGLLLVTLLISTSFCSNSNANKNDNGNSNGNNGNSGSNNGNSNSNGNTQNQSNGDNDYKSGQNTSESQSQSEEGNLQEENKNQTSTSEIEQKVTKKYVKSHLLVAVVYASGGCAIFMVLATIGWKIREKWERYNYHKVTIERLDIKYVNQKQIPITQVVFSSYFQKFYHLLEDVSSHRKTLTFHNHNSSKDMKIQSISYEDKSGYYYKMFLKGSDRFGQWQGEGAFTFYRGVPFFWILKEYDDWQAANQPDEKSVLVFETKVIGNESARGIWFYEGKQNKTGYYGDWNISTLMQVECSNISFD